MSCKSDSPHWAGCECHEAGWLKQLNLVRHDVVEIRTANSALQQSVAYFKEKLSQANAKLEIETDRSRVRGESLLAVQAKLECARNALKLAAYVHIDKRDQALVAAQAKAALDMVDSSVGTVNHQPTPDTPMPGMLRPGEIAIPTAWWRLPEKEMAEHILALAKRIREQTEKAETERYWTRCACGARYRPNGQSMCPDCADATRAPHYCPTWCHCRECGGFKPGGAPYGHSCSCAGEVKVR